ncbi:MAG: hypothetical protein H0T79_22955 [Deltaproteobacteria bacterium]|nr:hypothetical protein [Deltaproteobacteria bacterium]
MKTLAATLLAVATLAGSTAHADSPAELLERLGKELQWAWTKDHDTGDWLVSNTWHKGLEPAPCTVTLGELRAARVPATATIVVDQDGRDLRKGSHPLSTVRPACDAIEKAGMIVKFEEWVIEAAQNSSTSSIQVFERCLESYETILKRGVKPTDKVAARKLYIGNNEVLWSGTVEELSTKHCANALKNAKAQLAKREAPFRAVLKNDKLQMALRFNAAAEYALPGGDTSMDPKKLAAATVWFDAVSAPSNEPQNCANNGAPRTIVHRYTFDAAHTLVKTTSKEYCGTPPKGAYR